MKILYFAWLRQHTGVGEEDVARPEEVNTVAELLEWLRDRGAGYAEALGDETAIRVAVNRKFASLDSPVKDGDEIAMFPPLTGG